MHQIGLGTITILTICFGDSIYCFVNQQKRQLSPALQLEDNIKSLMRLHELGYKRSFGGRAHISPSMEFDSNLNELMTLQNIGKRPVLSPIDQYAQQFDVVQHLAAAGKKRALLPATNFHQQMQLSRMFADV